METKTDSRKLDLTQGASMLGVSPHKRFLAGNRVEALKR